MSQTIEISPSAVYTCEVRDSSARRILRVVIVIALLIFMFYVLRMMGITPASVIISIIAWIVFLILANQVSVIDRDWRGCKNLFASLRNH